MKLNIKPVISSNALSNLNRELTKIEDSNQLKGSGYTNILLKIRLTLDATISHEDALNSSPGCLKVFLTPTIQNYVLFTSNEIMNQYVESELDMRWGCYVNLEIQNSNGTILRANLLESVSTSLLDDIEDCILSANLVFDKEKEG